MSKYLITGGAGFIGSNFLRIMLNKYPEDKYVCVDALTYAGNKETLNDIINKTNFKFVHENICNRKAIYKLFKEEKFDYVINFAAESHVDRSIDNPEIFITTNVLGTQILMDACKKYGIKRFHQVSTDEVYGDLPLENTNLCFTEKSPIYVSSPYSASKASADLLVLAYYRTYKLPITISRCSNNYGPYQYPEKLIHYVQDRPGHDLKYTMDSTKIKNELHWQPNYNFEIGIIKTLKWNLENQNWLKSVTNKIDK